MMKNDRIDFHPSQKLRNLFNGQWWQVAWFRANKVFISTWQRLMQIVQYSEIWNVLRIILSTSIFSYEDWKVFKSTAMIVNVYMKYYFDSTCLYHFADKFIEIINLLSFSNKIKLYLLNKVLYASNLNLLIGVIRLPALSQAIVQLDYRLGQSIDYTVRLRLLEASSVWLCVFGVQNKKTIFYRFHLS